MHVCEFVRRQMFGVKWIHRWLLVLTRCSSMKLISPKPLHPYVPLPICSNVTSKPIPHTYPHTHIAPICSTLTFHRMIYLQKQIQQENNTFKIKIITTVISLVNQWSRKLACHVGSFSFTRGKKTGLEFNKHEEKKTPHEVEGFVTFVGFSPCGAVWAFVKSSLSQSLSFPPAIG